MSTLAEALAPKSDQLNADDLIPGPRTLKITNARISKEDRQTRIILNFEGDNGKPWKPCKTMGRAMVMVWAITDEKQMIGRSVRVYRDPEVRFGDQGQVGGIRISHMSDIDKPAQVKLTVSQGKKSVFTFAPLPSEVKADKVADGVRDLIERINAGEDVAADPAVQKQRAWLASKRPELAAEVDAALAAVTPADEDPFAGPSDNDRGEGHVLTADWLIGKINQCTKPQQIIDLVRGWSESIHELTEEDRTRIAEAQDAKALELRPAQ